VILLRQEPSGTVAFGEWEMNGEIGIVRLTAAGQVDCAFLAEGTKLSRET